MAVTMETIRTELDVIADRYGMGEITADSIERNAAALRDAMLAMDLDPADPMHVRALLVGSYLCLGHLVNSFIVLGPAMPLTYLQTRIGQLWLDGEMPMLSASDLLSLNELSLLAATCDHVVEWPTATGASSCKRPLGHAEPHLVQIIVQGPNGPAIVEIEVAE